MVTVLHTIIFIKLIISVTADVNVIEGEITVNSFKDKKAGFGPSIPKSGVKGKLVYLKPKFNKTCHDYEPNRPTDKENETIIALMERRGCTFLSMVLDAQLLKFDAVIVHNNFSSGEKLTGMLGTTDSKMEDVMISSVLVGYSAGQFLSSYDVKNEADNKNNHRFIYISDDVRIEYDTTSTNWIGYALSPTLFLLCPLMIGVCCCIIHYRNRTSVNRYLEKARRTRRHLPFHLYNIQVLKSCTPQIHAAKFKKALSRYLCWWTISHRGYHQLSSQYFGHRYDTCPICLEEFVEKEKLWILPCKHEFHISCIKSWLAERKHSCPMCKRMVISIPD